MQNTSIKSLPIFKSEEIILNSQLVKRALGKVPNPNILINTISRRVRQLLAGGGGASRPLIDDVAIMEENGKGAADIALLEIIHEKITWEEIDPEDEGDPRQSEVSP